MSQKNFSRGSLVFVSISFIVLMIISSAWLIFYFIQKIRYTNARDKNQRCLGDAAKKPISKLTTRTVKKGDKEIDPDFDHCAVCIESYKQNDVVEILPCKSSTAPRGCRAVKATRLQYRRLTHPQPLFRSLAYSALGSRRVGRHASALLVLFPFMFYTSAYPQYSVSQSISNRNKGLF